MAFAKQYQRKFKEVEMEKQQVKEINERNSREN